jgi:formyltetrahydrofolate synthetase
MVDHGHGQSKSSSKLGLAAALGHGGSPAMAQLREGSTGSLSRASLGHG